MSRDLHVIANNVTSFRQINPVTLVSECRVRVWVVTEYFLPRCIAAFGKRKESNK